MTLLRIIAETRPSANLPPTRYNSEIDAAEILIDESWIPSWEASVLSETKKFDVETGEDQKGH